MIHLRTVLAALPDLKILEKQEEYPERVGGNEVEKKFCKRWERGLSTKIDGGE